MRISVEASFNSLQFMYDAVNNFYDEFEKGWLVTWNGDDAGKKVK